MKQYMLVVMLGMAPLLYARGSGPVESSNPRNIGERIPLPQTGERIPLPQTGDVVPAFRSQTSQLRGDTMRHHVPVLSDAPLDSLNCRFLGNWPFGTADVVAADSTRHLVFGAAGGALLVADVTDPLVPRLLSDNGYTRGHIADLAYDETTRRLYVAEGKAGLEIWSVNDPLNPVRLGQCAGAGSALGVALAGQYAYVAASLGLRVVDISSPTNPFLVGNCEVPEDAGAVAVADTFAYLADASAGLRIINIRDPFNPYEVGYWDSLAADRVALMGNYAITTNDDAELAVIDISNPTQPLGVMDTALDYTLLAIETRGSLLYGLTDLPGLQVFDLQDPAHPLLVANHGTESEGYDLILAGHYGYVMDSYLGLMVYDISDPASGPHEIGRLGLVGRPEGVAVDGHFAYVCNDTFGLYIVSIADPAFPRLTGFTDLPGVATRVVLSGHYAFVATQEALQIVDVADSTSPVPVGSLAAETGIYDVATDGQYAYLPDGDSGLRIADVRDPAHPVEVGRLLTGLSYYAVAIRDTLAYVTSGDLALHVIAVADPTHPRLIGALDTIPGGSRVALYSHFALVALDAGLAILSVADPSLPRYVASYTSNDNTPDFVVMGNHVLLMNEYERIEVIDIADTAAPVLSNIVLADGDWTGIATSGQQVLLTDASFNGGFLVTLTVTNPAGGPQQLGTCPFLYGTSYAVDVQWPYAYFAQGGSGLFVIDVSSPPHFAKVGMIDPGSVRAVDVCGNYAYVERRTHDMVILDVRDPAHPVQAGLFSSAGHTYDVQVRDTLVFLAAADEGLQIVNAANPALPMLVGAWLSGDVRVVAVSGDYAYVGDYDDGLYVVDVSNPISPTQVALVPMGHIYDIAVAGSIAYVGTDSLRLFDISNPVQPNRVSGLYMGAHVNGIAVKGSTAFVAGLSTGLRVLDVSDPAYPQEVGNYMTPGQAYAVAATENGVYVADRSTGLQAFEYLPPTGVETPANTILTRSLHLARNPVTDGLIRLAIDLPATQAVKLGLYDLTGRRVTQFTLPGLKSGRNQVRLPVDKLASGIYFLAPEGSFSPRRLKLVVAREQ